MDLYSGHINKLIDELSGLPGIGSKSAQRLAFHLINMPKDKVNRLVKTIVEARENVRYCKECFTLTDSEVCPVCANGKGITTRLWWWKTPGIWRLMRKPESMRVFIMCSMELFLPCWELVLEISG